jgi:hypothetical protein
VVAAAVLVLTPQAVEVALEDIVHQLLENFQELALRQNLH